MLQALRSRGLSSVIYGVLIVGMALVFVLGFNPSANRQKASLQEQCAARVKGHCITPKDHMAAYRLLMPRGEQNEPLAAKAKQMNLLRVSLDGLIERELLDNDADRLGITVTDDEVTDSIYDGLIHVSLPSDKVSLGPYLRLHDGVFRVSFHDAKTKKFDLKVYERSIKAITGRSPTEFREEQVHEILAQKVRDLVKTPVRVSESEALDTYVDERSTATLIDITVRPSYLAKYLPAPLPSEVAAWAADEANKKNVEGAAEAHKNPHIRHILVKFDATATDAVKEAAKARVAAAIARVKHGESFESVAKQVSEDGSAGAGGDVGDQTDGFVAPFKDAADKLKPGEMTDEPVLTQFGYHAIKRDAAMTDDALKQMVATELVVRLRAEQAAKSMAEKILAGLKTGNAQKAIDDQIAPLMATWGSRAGAKKAADGKADKGDAKTAKADAKDAKADAKDAKTGAVADDTPENDPSRPQVNTTASFNRGGDPIQGLSPESNAKVIKFAFHAKDTDGMDEVLQAGQDYVLVALKEHKLATKEEFAKDKDVYLQTLVRQKQDEAFALYMGRLKEVAKNEIRVDEKYMADKMGTSKTADGGTPAPAEEEEEEGP